jgi:hypothetical protein
MYQILVVFCEIPENIKFFKLDIKTEQEYLEALKINNQFMNSNVNDKMSKLINDLFYDADGKYRFEEIKTPIYPKILYDAIIVTGIVV